MDQHELAALLAITQGAMSSSTASTLRAAPPADVSSSRQHVAPPSGPATTVPATRRSRSIPSLRRRKSIDNAKMPDFVGEERAAVSSGRLGVRSVKSFQHWPKSVAAAAPDPGELAHVSQSDHERRESRFSEGSMSNRSAGVASTWQQKTSARPEAEHSPVCADASEFQPVPTTPSTIKKTFSKLSSHFKAAGGGGGGGGAAAAAEDLPTNEPKSSKRRGLRKSLSTWNLHLGEKMHLFGNNNPSVDAASAKQPSVAEKELLDERKRKAEAVYAAEFGSKKHKGNDGRPTSPDRQPARSVRRRKSMPSTTATVHRQHLDRADRPARKLSRRELEEENQRLRALLRERADRQAPLSAQQPSALIPVDIAHPAAAAATAAPAPAATTPVASPRKFSLKYQQPTSSAPQPPALTTDQHQHASSSSAAAAAAGAASSDSSATTDKKKVSQDIPPVPPLPSRAVLATLALNHSRNNQNHTAYTQKSGPGSKSVTFSVGRRAQHGGGGGGGRGRLPRSISTILEADDDGDDDDDDENMPRLEVGSVLPEQQEAKEVKEVKKEDEWQWPDDVF